MRSLRQVNQIVLALRLPAQSFQNDWVVIVSAVRNTTQT
jgi:hypothetical protein